MRLTARHWDATLVTGCLVAALWILTHPYMGIYHDGRIYAADALHYLTPGVLDGDLFFRFGSQGDLSLFTPFYAFLIRYLGLTAAALLLLALAHAAWVAGLFLLLSRFDFSPPMRALAFVGILVLPRHYSSYDVLAIMESFMTPRILAEAAVMICLGLCGGNRWLSGLVALAVGMALHPLVALGGAGLVLLLAAARDRRVLWLIPFGVLAIAGAALAGLDPFVRVLRSFDEPWLAVILERNALGFLADWTADDWWRLVTRALVAALALIYATAKERVFIGATIVLVAGAMLTSFVGADLLHNVLITNLQLWRLGWLAVVTVNLFALVTVVRMAGTPMASGGRGLRHPAAGAVMGLALHAMAAAVMIPHWVPALVLFMTLVLLGYDRLVRQEVSRKMLRFMAATVALCGALALVYFVALTAYRVFAVSEDVINAIFWPGVRSANIAWFALFVATSAVLILRDRLLLPVIRTTGRRALVFSLLAALLALSASGWDRRSDWDRFIENPDLPTPELDRILAGTTAIYWEDDTAMIWLKLQKQSHFSCLQGAGLMFTRATALEFKRLSSVYGALDLPEIERVRICRRPDRKDDPKTVFKQKSADDLRRLCRLEPALDALVFTLPIPALAADTWTPDTIREVVEMSTEGAVWRPVHTYYIYHCRDLVSDRPMAETAP